MAPRQVTTSPQSGARAPASQIDGSPTPDERIWLVVAGIPRGRVASYGKVAELAGLPRRARYVGRVLSRLPQGTRLPWHRVVNASLRISTRHRGGALPDARAPRNAAALAQRRRLEREGVRFIGDRIAPQHRWPQ